MLKKYFHHKWLNDSLKVEALDLKYIAEWIFDFLKQKLGNLYEVTVYSSPDTFETVGLAQSQRDQ